MQEQSQKSENPKILDYSELPLENYEGHNENTLSGLSQKNKVFVYKMGLFIFFHDKLSQCFRVLCRLVDRNSLYKTMCVKIPVIFVT